MTTTWSKFAGPGTVSFGNVNAVDTLCVQHEYGIFGGKSGSHLLALLRELRMPIVTTLHTILAEPTPAQRIASIALATGSVRELLDWLDEHGS